MIAGVDLPIEIGAVILVAGVLSAWALLRPQIEALFAAVADAFPNPVTVARAIYSALLGLGGVLYDHTVGAARAWVSAVTADLSALSYGLANLAAFAHTITDYLGGAVKGGFDWLAATVGAVAADLSGLHAWIDRTFTPHIEARIQEVARDVAGPIAADLEGLHAWIDRVLVPHVDELLAGVAATAALATAGVASRVAELEAEAEHCFRPTCQTVGDVADWLRLLKRLQTGLFMAQLAEIMAHGPEWFIAQVLGAAESAADDVESWVSRWLGGAGAGAPPGPVISLDVLRAA